MAEEKSISEMIADGFNDFNSAGCFGFFDWLVLQRFVSSRQVEASPVCSSFYCRRHRQVRPEKQLCVFTNSCPSRGSLYDDFRICSIETGNVRYIVVPKSGHTGQSEVWGRENNFNKPIVSGSCSEVKAFFKG